MPLMRLSLVQLFFGLFLDTGVGVYSYMNKQLTR